MKGSAGGTRLAVRRCSQREVGRIFQTRKPMSPVGSRQASLRLRKSLVGEILPLFSSPIHHSTMRFSFRHTFAIKDIIVTKLTAQCLNAKSGDQTQTVGPYGL